MENQFSPEQREGVDLQLSEECPHTDHRDLGPLDAGLDDEDACGDRSCGENSRHHEANRANLLVVSVVVMLAVLAAYCYMNTGVDDQSGLPDLRRPNAVASNGPTTSIEGRSVSEKEATISLFLYAIVEAAKHQGRTQFAEVKRKKGMS